ncbi:MAG TPA: IS3 family transposase [Longimicrobiales bacterium]
MREPQEALRSRIREFAAQRPRWGYRRIHLLLRREGWSVNRKRVQRIYREEGLAVRWKGKRRRSQVPRPVREPLGRVNERWSLDFVNDTLSTGRTFRCLTVVDEFSRECLAIHVAHSIPAVRVIEVLEQLRAERGLPESEDQLHSAGQARTERLHRELQRDASGRVPDLHWFVSLAGARRTIEAWRTDYNRVRPHSSLGDLTPEEFVQVQSRSEEALATTINAAVPE